MEKNLKGKKQRKINGFNLSLIHIFANGADFHVIHKIMQGRKHGTLFLADKKEQDILQKLFENL